jgi:hypothetical protein
MAETLSGQRFEHGVLAHLHLVLDVHFLEVVEQFIDGGRMNNTEHPPSAAFFDLPFDWKTAMEAWNRWHMRRGV